MNRQLFIIFVFSALVATAQAPDITYSVSLTEDYINRNLTSANMYANIAAHGDPYMAGYFAGRAEVYAELKAIIEWLKREPNDK